MTMCTFVCEDDCYLLKDSQAPDARVISISPETVSLIAQTTLADNLYVCSSNVLPMSKLSVDNPEATLSACREAFDYPREVGGPRLLTEEEQAAAKVTALMRMVSPECERFRKFFELQILPAVQKHPAWQAGLGFATGGDITFSTACVLSGLYDILRFAKKPGRIKDRLRSYYRLITAKQFNMDAQVVFADFLTSESPGKRRLLYLVSAWANSPLSQLPAELLDDVPHAFLQRNMLIWIDHFMSQGVEACRATNLAVYRATLRFLEFLRFMWLHGLGVLRFDPFRFFGEDWEAKAFVEYVDQIA